MFLSIHAFPVSPLIFYALAMITGIVWQMHTPTPFIIMHLIIIGILLFLSFYQYYSIKIVLVLLSFILGALTYQRHINWYTQVENYVLNHPANLTIKILDQDTKKHSFLRYIYTGTIQEIVCTQTGLRIHPSFKILIYTYKRLPIKIGDVIKIFDYQQKRPSCKGMGSFLKKEKIFSILVQKTLSFSTCYIQSYSWTSLLHYYRRAHLQSIRQKLSGLSYRLYSLIFLGKKPHINDELQKLKNNCQHWGIAHHLARSGLHLVACIFAWEKILHYVPISQLVKQLFLLLFTIIYYLLSWPSVSFVRSMLVFIFYKIAHLSSYQAFSIHIMALVTLLTVLHNPLVISFLDFQLSFGITFLLTWINHVNILRNRTKIKNYC